MKRPLKKGQVILTTEAPVGNVAQIEQEKHYILSQRVIAFETNANLSDDFLYFLIQKNKSVLLRYSTGGTAKGISQKSLKQVKVYLSTCITEQIKISQLHRIIKNLITLYERKIEYLSKIKYYFVQKIFSHLNAVRQIKIKELCNLKQWSTITSKEMKPIGYPVYGANGKIGFYDKYNHENPTICVTCRGATSGNILISDSFSYITGNAMCLDNLDENVNIKYLFEYLKFRGLQDVVTGSAQPQITSSLLGVVKIPFISKDKQDYFANIFKIFDSLTNNYKRKKNNLEKIKMFLLNIMFI